MELTTAITVIVQFFGPRVAPLKKPLHDVVMEVMLEEAAWVILHILVPIIISILVGLGLSGAYHLPFEGADVAQQAAEARSHTDTTTPTATTKTVYIVVEKGSPEWDQLQQELSTSQDLTSQ